MRVHAGPHSMAHPTDNPGTTNPDPLLTVSQAAHYLGVSDKLVRREISAGRLTRTTVGRYIRVRQSALEAYLANSTR